MLLQILSLVKKPNLVQRKQHLEKKQLNHVLEKKQNKQYKELKSQLSELNPLKRLIAVQDVSQLLEKKQLNINQEKEVLEYFKFMLNQEQEIVIRQNILKNLF